MNKLQRNSISWDGMRNSNINDFLSDSDDEEAVITSKKSNGKKKDKIKKNSLETSISKIQDKSRRKGEFFVVYCVKKCGKVGSGISLARNCRTSQRPIINFSKSLLHVFSSVLHRECNTTYQNRPGNNDEENVSS